MLKYFSNKNPSLVYVFKIFDRLIIEQVFLNGGFLEWCNK